MIIGLSSMETVSEDLEADEVIQLPSSPREDHPSPEGSPSADVSLSIEKETNIMTQDELDHLRESCSFPSNIQIRLLKTNETIVSTRPGEVVFYEVAFHAGLCLPIHPIIRRDAEVLRIPRSWGTPGDLKAQVLQRGQPFWVVIGGKCPWGETSNISPSKKVKKVYEDKKKRSSGKAPAKSRATSNAMASKGAAPAIAPREGTSANPGAILRLNASMLENPAMAKKLLNGVIPPLDKEERQISYLYLDLDIHDMGINADLLKEEEEGKPDNSLTPS
ncbi:hypothetical protein Acr_07g0014420 [Actinidia rufa]|uniref:Uncharacterized protein n=1 Tax=Actinidia rufa TaxID=165716 RepID=A0A7J0EYH5_9ERIC|nr:hypothetical protein Acr_07g0014420 [Actinidia rufa]